MLYDVNLRLRLNLRLLMLGMNYWLVNLYLLSCWSWGYCVSWICVRMIRNRLSRVGVFLEKYQDCLRKHISRLNGIHVQLDSSSLVPHTHDHYVLTICLEMNVLIGES